MIWIDHTSVIIDYCPKRGNGLIKIIAIMDNWIMREEGNKGKEEKREEGKEERKEGRR